MEINVSIPDALATPLIPPGREPSRAALEALALEAYRVRRLTGDQLRTLLGIPSRDQLDAFLKEHQVEAYTREDFEHDLATIRESDTTAPGGFRPKRMSIICSISRQRSRGSLRPTSIFPQSSSITYGNAFPATRNRNAPGCART